MNLNKNSGIFIRNFIFGVEDSLVSTVGLLSGVAITNMPSSEIVTTGIILIFVEAFSMGVGSLLSEHSVEEYENHKNIPFWNAALGAITMFFTYFVFGFIPLSPYIFISIKYAFWISIIFSLISLFLLGSLSSRFSGVKVLRSGIQMFLIGGSAIAIGIIVGKFIRPIF